MNIYLSAGDLVSTALGRKHIDNTAEMLRSIGHTVLHAGLLPPTLHLDKSRRVQSTMMGVCDVVYVLVSHEGDPLQQWELEAAAILGKRTCREDETGHERDYLIRMAV